MLILRLVVLALLVTSSAWAQSAPAPAAPFSLDRVAEIDIRMAPEDWRIVRLSHRDVDATGLPDSDKGFDYRRAEIRIDGVTSTTLLMPAGAHGVGTGELDVGIAIDADGPAEVRIPLVPNRCDPSSSDSEPIEWNPWFCTRTTITLTRSWTAVTSSVGIIR